MEEQLRVALGDGVCLVDSSPSTPSHDLKSVLVSRLSSYYARRGSGSISGSGSLEETQLVTAREALSVIDRIHRITSDTDNTDTGIPLIGTRDLGQLRTLLSIVFKWGVEPLSKVVLAWPTKNASESHGPRIIDLTTSSEDYELLLFMISVLMNLLFSNGVQGAISQTLITTIMLERHLIDLLKPCITLGWVPKYLASHSRPSLDGARLFTTRLLNLYASYTFFSSS